MMLFVAVSGASLCLGLTMNVYGFRVYCCAKPFWDQADLRGELPAVMLHRYHLSL